MVKFVPINIVAAVMLETFRSHVCFKLIQFTSNEKYISEYEKEILVGSIIGIIPDFGSN